MVMEKSLCSCVVFIVCLWCFLFLFLFFEKLEELNLYIHPWLSFFFFPLRY